MIAETAEPVAVLSFIPPIIWLMNFREKLAGRLDKFTLAEMTCQYYATQSNRNYSPITNVASVFACLVSEFGSRKKN